jgi:hypothetical protein
MERSVTDKMTQAELAIGELAESLYAATDIDRLAGRLPNVARIMARRREITGEVDEMGRKRSQGPRKYVTVTNASMDSAA